MRSARDDVRGGNHVSNNNAREGASGNLKSNKKEKEEGAEAAGTTTKRTRESHENSSNNASNVARGKRKARDSNNNAKGGARSVMKRNKGGNENENKNKKREEDANAGETLRSMKETLDSSINNASSVVRGKNKANVSNKNAKGGNFFDFLRTLRDNWSGW